MGKREKFAVNLRKKKTQEIVKAKRRKIIEALNSKQKEQSQMDSGAFSTAANDSSQFKDDSELSIGEMEQ